MSDVRALEVRDLSLRFGNVTAFEHVSFCVDAEQLLAVIGPNGAGKTSLFNVLSRVYRPTTGAVSYFGQDLLRMRVDRLAGRGIARSFQNLALFDRLSVLENVLVGRHHLLRADVVRGGVYLGRARREEKQHRAAALEALEFVGLKGEADASVRALPYGLQKRVELARCLAMEPRLLLLDEPVAGMSLSERGEITDLVRRIRRERRMTVLLVEHDMGMVAQVADRVLVLDFGHPIAEGTPAQVQADERVIRAYLGNATHEGERIATASAPLAPNGQVTA